MCVEEATCARARAGACVMCTDRCGYQQVPICTRAVSIAYYTANPNLYTGGVTCVEVATCMENLVTAVHGLLFKPLAYMRKETRLDTIGLHDSAVWAWMVLRVRIYFRIHVINECSEQQMQSTVTRICKAALGTAYGVL